MGPYYCERHAVWVNPDGRVLALIDECDDPVAWTNDPALRARMPASLVAWMQTLERGPLDPTTITWNEVPPSDTRCFDSAMQREEQKAARREEGTLCDSEIAPSGIAVVVARQGRAALGRPGGPCPRATTRPRRYLVPGDLVLTGSLDGDCECVVFPSARGRTAGWMHLIDLEPIDTTAVDKVWPRLATLAESLPERSTLEGDFTNFAYSPLEIVPSLRISRQGNEWSASIIWCIGDGEWQEAGALTRTGRRFALPAGDDCSFEILRFNNGLIVKADDDACGALAHPPCFVSGVYLPEED